MHHPTIRLHLLSLTSTFFRSQLPFHQTTCTIFISVFLIIVLLFRFPPTLLPPTPLLSVQNVQHPTLQSHSQSHPHPQSYVVVQPSESLPQNDEHLRSRLLTSLPPCAHTGRASTFLMVFMGHSGSTALMTSLKQHSQVHIDGFEPVDHGVYVTGKSPAGSLKALEHTSQFFRNGTKLGKTAGFKIRPRHLLALHGKFSHLLKLFKTRVVWSYRANMMKQALGDYAIHFKGDKSGYEGLKLHKNGTEMLSKVEQNRMKTFRVHDMGALHKLLKSRVSGDRQIVGALQKISLDHCVLPVSYESYLLRPELTLERVQRFLGLEGHELHPALRKKATEDSICQLVENWDELCNAFFRCENWRWMLDDFENGCACSGLKPSLFGTPGKYCSMG